MSQILQLPRLNSLHVPSRLNASTLVICSVQDIINTVRYNINISGYSSTVLVVLLHGQRGVASHLLYGVLERKGFG